MTRSPQRLLDFVAGMTRLVSSGPHDEAAMLKETSGLMRTLVAQDDWLPEPFTVPHPQYYQQYLLYGDPLDRFSLVSFVWGPGQQTPVHDHTVWGVIGMLRGSEIDTGYRCNPNGGAPEVLRENRLMPGDVACVSPTIGDVHRVRNAFDDQVSISIHVYGTNIGRVRRHVFDATTGAAKDFVSGYSGAVAANLWATA